MSEDISKIISKYKMYMSFNGNEYQMIEKVELNKTFEEIERLNNIINELEKWLEERLDKLDINGYDDDVFNGIEIALQKLKELKGSDKE